MADEIYGDFTVPEQGSNYGTKVDPTIKAVADIALGNEKPDGLAVKKQGDFGVDTDGDVEILKSGLNEVVSGQRKNRQNLEFTTIQEAIDSKIINEGSVVKLKERTTGNGGGSTWDAVLTSSVTPNGFDIVELQGVINLSVVLRVDDTVYLSAVGDLGRAIVLMNDSKLHLDIDIDTTMSNTNIIINGHCDIGGSAIITTDNNSFIRCQNTISNKIICTSFGADVVNGLYTQYVSVSDVSSIVKGSVIYIASDSEIYKTGSYRAESFTVSYIDGNKVYLDGFFIDGMGTTGYCYLYNNNKCIININVISPSDTDISATTSYVVSVENYINPVLLGSFNKLSSSAYRVISCYGGRAIFSASNLLSSSQDNIFGYAIALYGATKGMDVNVLASQCRHAYTDGVLVTSEDSLYGCVIGSRVTGIAKGCTMASWDTHPYSDGVLFHDCTTLGDRSDTFENVSGTRYSYHIRGTNSSIQGGYSDTDLFVAYLTGSYRIRKSKTTVDGVARASQSLRGYRDVKIFANGDAPSPDSFTEDHDIEISNTYLRGFIYSDVGISFAKFSRCTIDTIDGKLLQDASVSDQTTLQYFIECVFKGFTDATSLWGGTLVMKDCVLEGSNPFSIRGDDCIVICDGLLCESDTLGWASVFWFANGTDPKPTGCELRYNNISTNALNLVKEFGSGGGTLSIVPMNTTSVI